MKLVRFLARSYADGRIIESGEEVMMPDDFPMGRHTVDVGIENQAIASGELAAPVTRMPPMAVRPDAVFRTDLAYDITASAGVPVFPTWESQKAMDAMTIHAADNNPAITRPVMHANLLTASEPLPDGQVLEGAVIEPALNASGD